MKARLGMLVCLCGAHLVREIDKEGWYLTCDTQGCEANGKRLKPPEFELEEYDNAERTDPD